MCGSMLDIQSTATEIRRGKKERNKEITGQKYNGLPYYRVTIKSCCAFPRQRNWHVVTWPPVETLRWVCLSVCLFLSETVWFCLSYVTSDFIREKEWRLYWSYCCAAVIRVTW